MNSNSRYIEDACRKDRRDFDDRNKNNKLQLLKCSSPGDCCSGLEEVAQPLHLSLTVNTANFCIHY